MLLTTNEAMVVLSLEMDGYNETHGTEHDPYKIAESWFMLQLCYQCEHDGIEEIDMESIRRQSREFVVTKDLQVRREPSTGRLYVLAAPEAPNTK